MVMKNYLMASNVKERNEGKVHIKLMIVVVAQSFFWCLFISYYNLRKSPYNVSSDLNCTIKESEIKSKFDTCSASLLWFRFNFIFRNWCCLRPLNCFEIERNKNKKMSIMPWHSWRCQVLLYYCYCCRISSIHSGNTIYNPLLLQFLWYLLLLSDAPNLIFLLLSKSWP